jgi:hypothetical protein
VSDNSLRERLDVLKNVVEILAILVAGIWGVYVYMVRDRPSLQPRALLDTSLTWEQEDTRCLATAAITFDNASAASLDVVRESVVAKIIPFEALPKAPVAVIDFNALLKQPGVWTLPSPPGGETTKLKGHYAPGTKAGDAVQWLIRRPPPNREEWMFVETSLEDHRGHVWTSRRWDYLCNQHAHQ